MHIFLRARQKINTANVPFRPFFSVPKDFFEN
jgi:hypothetical protein